VPRYVGASPIEGYTIEDVDIELLNASSSPEVRFVKELYVADKRLVLGEVVGLRLQDLPHAGLCVTGTAPLVLIAQFGEGTELLLRDSEFA
jgi:hypothetical protein